MPGNSWFRYIGFQNLLLDQVGKVNVRRAHAMTMWVSIRTASGGFRNFAFRPPGGDFRFRFSFGQAALSAFFPGFAMKMSH
jgi:hypothetical protein